jgi:F1F0 ATPase subunit 2
MNLPALLGFFVVGMLAGAVHVALLRRNTQMYLHSSGVGKAVALQMLRLALLGGVLWVLAEHGAPALLAGAAGVLAARQLILRRIASVAP